MSKRRRGYFKHYNDATNGSSIGALLRKRDYLAVALYWYFIELCNQKNADKIDIEWTELTHRFCARSSTIVRSLLNIRSTFVSFQFNYNETLVQLEIANYLEYQDLRSTNNPRKSDENAPIKDKRLKIKDKIKKYTKKESKDSGPPAEFLSRLWNEAIELTKCDLPKVRGLTDKRKKSVRERLKENPDEAYWVQVVEKIIASDFCRGKGDRNWKANFDFLIRPDTHVKVMEGQYDNKKRSGGFSI